MKALTCRSLVCAGLAFLGCKAADTSSAEDAGLPSDSALATPDLPPADLAPAPDLAAILSAAPDIAPSLAAADAPPGEDTAPDVTVASVPDVAPAVAAPDLAPDTVSASASIDTARDSIPPTDLATFCTGGASKMIVNGLSSNPSVAGKVLTYDCCRGGEFEITTATFAQPIVVSWQAATSAFSGFKTIDLANPPTGWSFRVSAGCGSELACTDPADSYTSGLTGSLAIAIGKRAMYDMSVCLHVEESPSSPHPVIQSLDLYATHIDAN